MKKCILDTSVWIAYLHKQDSCHEKAKILFKKIGNSKIVMNQVIFSEIIFTLKKLNYKKETIIELLYSIRKKYKFEIDHSTAKNFTQNRVVKLIFDSKFQVQDLFILLFAIENKNYIFYTYDIHLRKNYEKETNI